MYKKSKRFLAAFLALLLVITMLPTDALRMVYATEVSDVIESEPFEPRGNVEEAEVFENTLPDDDAKEVPEENDLVTDGKDDETPEGNPSSTPTSSQLETTTPSQPDSTTPESSQPDSTTPESSEPESTTPKPGETTTKEIVYILNGDDVYNENVYNSKFNTDTPVGSDDYFTVLANGSVNLIVLFEQAGENGESVGKNDFMASLSSQRYSAYNWKDTLDDGTTLFHTISLTSGSMASDKNAIKFTTKTKNAKVVVYAALKNTASSGRLVINSTGDKNDIDANAVFTSKDLAGDADRAEIMKFDNITIADPGTYYLGFTSSGGIVPYMTVTETIEVSDTPDDPEAMPANNSVVDEGEKVSLSILDNEATIYYTTGADENSTADPTTAADKKIYNNTDKIAIDFDHKVIKAYAEKNGNKSNVVSFSYSVRVSAPKANPENIVLTAGGKITLTSATTDDADTADADKVKIYYTTDGTTPSSASNLYTEPFTIPATSVIKAVATKTGWADSNVSAFTYIVQTTEKTEYIADGSASTINPYFTLASNTNTNQTISSNWPSDLDWADYDISETPPTKVIRMTSGSLASEGSTVANGVYFTTSGMNTRVVVYYSSKGTGENIILQLSKLTDDGKVSADITSAASSHTKIMKAEFMINEPGIYSVGFRGGTSGGGIIPYMIVTENPGASSTASYTVKFYDGTDELTELETTVAADDTLDISTITVPTKEGKIFKGWATSADAAVPDAEGTITVTADTNLYAVWEDLVTIILMDGAAEVQRITAKAGDTVDLSKYTVTAEVGKTFLGWATTINAQAADAVVVTVTADTTYYAVMVDSSSVKEYTVTRNYGYEENGTAKTDTFPVYYTDENPFVTITLNELGTPEREGFTFVKWTVGTPAADVPETGYEISADTTFTAEWKEDGYYTVTFKDGDTIVNAVTVENGTSLKLSAFILDTKPGKVFYGWNDEYGNFYYYKDKPNELTVTEDITLTAAWRDTDTCTITFMNGDTEIAKVEAEKASYFSNLTQYAPKAEGKVCMGWSETKNAAEADYKREILVTKDITLYAVLINETDAKYTVKYVSYYFIHPLEGDSVETTEEVAPGTKIKLPDPGTRSGYAFIGWECYSDGTMYQAGDEYTVNEDDICFVQWWTETDVPKTGMDVHVGDALYSGGTAVLPNWIYVYHKGEQLYEGIDYTVKAKNNKNVGTAKTPYATLTVVGIGNYKGLKKEVPFRVIPRDIDDSYYNNFDKVHSPSAMTVITGTKISLAITYKGKQLKLGKDFTLSEGSNINAKGKYTGTVTKPAEFNPDGSIKDYGEIRTMTVTGIGNYRGTREIEIRVVDPKNAKKLAVEIDKNFKPVVGDDMEYLFCDRPKRDDEGNFIYDENGNYVYEENSKKIRVLDKTTKAVLTEDKDFLVIYNTDISRDTGYFDAGTVKFTVIGIGEYTGSVSKSFKISPQKLSDSDIEAGVYKVNGENQELKTTDLSTEYTLNEGGATLNLIVRCKVGENENKEPKYRRLYEGADYTVSYSNNKKVGKAKAKITFINNYKGTKAKTVDFTVTGATLNFLNVVVPDIPYTGAGKSYVSKPVIFDSYDMGNGYYWNDMFIKASEYKVSYEWVSASQYDTTDAAGNDTTAWKADDKVKIILDGTDTYAVVRATITPSANSNYVLKKDEDGKDVPLVMQYVVEKADGGIDLSKAKVEFFSQPSCTEESKYKALQFCYAGFFTPVHNQDVKGEDGAVYAKVTVNNQVVDPKLYNVSWICNTFHVGNGKATVIISGHGRPIQAEGATPASTAFAVGSKTVSIKINPLKTWIEPEKAMQAVTDALKKLF